MMSRILVTLHFTRREDLRTQSRRLKIYQSSIGWQLSSNRDASKVQHSKMLALPRYYRIVIPVLFASSLDRWRWTAQNWESLWSRASKCRCYLTSDSWIWFCELLSVREIGCCVEEDATFEGNHLNSKTTATVVDFARRRTGYSTVNHLRDKNFIDLGFYRLRNYTQLSRVITELVCYLWSKRIDWKRMKKIWSKLIN